MTTMTSPPSRLASPLLRRLACRASGWGLAVWALGGCLLPQDESLLNELPVYRNSAPRILENQVQPTNRIIRGYGQFPTCALDFSAIAEDIDASDILYVYWYVDYDPSVRRGADLEYQIHPVPTEFKTVRDERATLRARYNSTDLYRLNIPGDHVVELIISDRVLVGREPQADQNPLSDGGTISVPGYSASYVWFVRTEAGATCP